MTVFSRDGSQHECEGKITPKWLQYTVLPHGDTTGVCGEKVIVCSMHGGCLPTCIHSGPVVSAGMTPGHFSTKPLGVNLELIWGHPQ